MVKTTVRTFVHGLTLHTTICSCPHCVYTQS